MAVNEELLGFVRDEIRWSVSALIVAFPVFLYMSWLTGRAIQRDPVKRASNIRRWLTYLTLFMAATTLIGDVTTLVYNVLSGELTVRFVLKVVTVALIGGTAFTYYLRDLRLDELWKGVGLPVSFDAIRDPVPANAYRYRVLGAENFELCGTFERASEPQTRGGVDVWQHPAGAHCFTLKVEKRSTQ